MSKLTKYSSLNSEFSLRKEYKAVSRTVHGFYAANNTYIRRVEKLSPAEVEERYQSILARKKNPACALKDRSNEQSNKAEQFFLRQTGISTERAQKIQNFLSFERRQIFDNAISDFLAQEEGSYIDEKRRKIIECIISDQIFDNNYKRLIEYVDSESIAYVPYGCRHDVRHKGPCASDDFSVAMQIELSHLNLRIPIQDYEYQQHMTFEK